MKYALLALLFVASAWAALAADRFAASASVTDVQTEINAATAGDVIHIPATAGTSWDRTLEVTKAVHIKGAGKDATILIDDVNSANKGTSGTLSTASAEAMVRLAAPAGTGTIARLSDLQIDHNRTTQYFNGTVQIVTGQSYGVVERCDFTLDSNMGVFSKAGSYGLVADCYFTITAGNQHPTKCEWNAVDGQGAYGDYAFETAVPYGTDKFFIVEDCTMDRTIAASTYGAIDGWGGSRVIFRHNELINCGIANHGNDSSGRFRSMRVLIAHDNTLTNLVSGQTPFDSRGGLFIIFNNHVTDGTKYSTNPTKIQLNNYRMFAHYNNFQGASGYSGWDAVSLADGAGTPGGAGDGIWESGTATAASTDSMTDSGKSWSTNEWIGYTLRMIGASGTSTSGTVSPTTLTDTGASWSTNEFAGWWCRLVPTNEVFKIASNTSTTLTRTTGTSHVPDCSINGGVNAYIVFSSGVIASNTATVITTTTAAPQPGNHNWVAGYDYEIIRIDYALDQPGRGTTATFPFYLGDTFYPKSNTWTFGIALDPCYEWNNTITGGASSNLNFVAGNIYQYSIIEGREYYNDTEKPGYTELAYPHPMRSEVFVTKARRPAQARRAILSVK